MKYRFIKKWMMCFFNNTYEKRNKYWNKCFNRFVAYELLIYSLAGGYTYSIDGLTISLKDKRDAESFYKLQKLINIRLMMNNIWVYVFESAHFNINDVNNLPFTFMNRDWQEDFRPEPNSIFRRISTFM